MTDTSPRRVPILYNYFRDTANIILAHYERSKGLRSTVDAGNVREDFVNDFLSKVLPRSFSVESGEILDSEDHQSGQLDTVILRNDSPRLTFGSERTNAFVAEAVYAVIETKSFLDSGKLGQAIETLRRVAQLKPRSFTQIALGPTLDRPIRAVFAYDGVTPHALITEEDRIEDRKIADVICILNQATWIRCDLARKLQLIIPDGMVDTDYIGYRTSALALASFNYVLTTFAASFAARSVNLSNYIAGAWPQ